ncbi:hypothetical protein AOLI_G00232820 [Acnodon oligacanthus]
MATVAEVLRPRRTSSGEDNQLQQYKKKHPFKQTGPLLNEDRYTTQTMLYCSQNRWHDRIIQSNPHVTQSQNEVEADAGKWLEFLQEIFGFFLFRLLLYGWKPRGTWTSSADTGRVDLQSAKVKYILLLSVKPYVYKAGEFDPGSKTSIPGPQQGLPDTRETGFLIHSAQKAARQSILCMRADKQSSSVLNYLCLIYLPPNVARGLIEIHPRKACRDL